MQPDAHTSKRGGWRSGLSPESEQALAQGVFEPPKTGKYVRTDTVGVYHCVGCDAPLFSSQVKVDDGSGYAAFTNPLYETAVSLVTNYSPTGDPVVGFVCGRCGGALGRVDTLSLQSDADLAQGTTERIYHASSHAVVLHKAKSVRNYPVASLAILLLLSMFGYAVWMWTHTLSSVSEYASMDATVPLWVGDVEVRAFVVRLDQPTASTSGMMVKEGQAILAVLGDGRDVPAIRFANHSVDVLWMDTRFKVLGWERERASQSTKKLASPLGAKFALIAQTGTVPSSAFSEGFEVFVTDKSTLF
jgi:peptide-methionine (R)-S-oxide reductase